MSLIHNAGVKQEGALTFPAVFITDLISLLQALEDFI